MQNEIVLSKVTVLASDLTLTKHSDTDFRIQVLNNEDPDLNAQAEIYTSFDDAWKAFREKLDRMMIPLEHVARFVML